MKGKRERERMGVVFKDRSKEPREAMWDRAPKVV